MTRAAPMTFEEARKAKEVLESLRHDIYIQTYVNGALARIGGAIADGNPYANEWSARYSWWHEGWKEMDNALAEVNH